MGLRSRRPTTTAESPGIAQPCQMNDSNQSTALWPLAIVVLFACVVNLPCLIWGLQFGDDHNLHVTYLHFFDAQLRAGELYPHWISGLNFGAGSPIFFVQYPLPYYVAAGLRWVFHLSAIPVGEAHALGLFVFFTGIVAGVSSWLWCRALANPVAAAVASAAYLTMPYVYWCDVYHRAAIGEYSALAWVPLALFFAHRIDTRPRLAIAGMASAFAAVILSNLFTAVLFAPFLVLYAICRVSRPKMWMAAAIVAFALALGVGISGAYFLPMNAHRTFFSLTKLVKLGPGIFFYRDHLFPFGETLFPSSSFSLRIVDLISEGLGIATAAVLVVRWRRSQTNRFLASLAIVCILLTCAAPLFHWVGFVPHPELAIFRVIDVRSRIFLVTLFTLEAALLSFACLRTYAEPLPKFLLAACLACYFLSTRWSEGIWQHASFLWNIQFPWRLSGLLSIFAVGLFGLALGDLWDSPRPRKKMLLAFAVLWLAIGISSYVALDIRGYLARPFSTEIKRKVETAYPVYANISQLPTPNELGPNDGFTDQVLLLAGEGTARLDPVTPRHLRLEADCPRACTLLLKLAYYPFWRAYEASNKPVPLQPSKRAGLTELSLGPGAHVVDLELPFGRPEIWGAWLSFLSLAVAAFLFLGGRKQNGSQP